MTKIMKSLLGSLTIGIVAMVGTAAHATGLSGYGFRAINTDDMGFIAYSVGAVYNTDFNNNRVVFADLGANFAPNLSSGKYQVTIFGNDSSPNAFQTCKLIARNQQSGVATWNSATGQVSGNFSYNVVLGGLNQTGTTYAFTLECTLSATFFGTAYIFATSGPVMVN